jgi:hypothetical protein
LKICSSTTVSLVSIFELNYTSWINDNLPWLNVSPKSLK